MTLKIDSYRFGEVNIDGQVFRKDVIIFPKRVFPNWRRATGHSLCMEDLSSVLKDPPKVLILGQGAYARMEVPRTVQEQLEANGVQVISRPTKEACELYNQLRDEIRVVAALHLTC